ANEEKKIDFRRGREAAKEFLALEQLRAFAPSREPNFFLLDWLSARCGSRNDGSLHIIRRDRLVGGQGEAAQGDCHCRGARRGGAAAEPAGAALAGRHTR